MIKFKENPLVSIIVITYNSSKYVLDTLESVKTQSYKNIELIITDDGSSDNTPKVCGKWIKENELFFKGIKLILVEKNTGTPANCNRGVKEAKGKWIKLIAGDDVLLNKCIEININNINKSKAPLFFSKMKVFNKQGILVKSSYYHNKGSKKFGAKEKKNKKKSYLRYPSAISTPSFFIRKDLITALNGFDEGFKVLEDQPFLYKLFLNGFDINFIDQYTVSYRRHDESVTGGGGELLKKEVYKSYITYAKPNLNKWNLKDKIFEVYTDCSFYIKRKKLDKYILFSFFLRLKKILYLLN